MGSVKIDENADEIEGIFRVKNTQDLEMALVEFGHTLSLHEQEQIASYGRAIKELCPGVCAYLKQAQERDEPPGLAILGAVRAMAMLTLIMAEPQCEPGKSEEMRKCLGQAYIDAMNKKMVEVRAAKSASNLH